MFSYLVSRAIMGGSWYPPVVFLVVVVVVFAVRHGRQGPMVGVKEVRREAVHLKPLTDRLQRAMELGEAGDLAAAVELIDSVAAHPATERLPLIAANVAMLRSDIAVAQGDLPTAEREAVTAVRHHEQGTNRSTWSEALEKLGRIQLTSGRNEDAHRTLTQALEVGGGFMFRLSRVRVELYLTNIALDADDIPAPSNTPRPHGSSPPSGAADPSTRSRATCSPSWPWRRTAPTTPPGGQPRRHESWGTTTAPCPNASAT
ncbi:hypothetical protein WKI71_04255 [Streptomyces sp. MS1.AVA.1]|uniref:Tetratricopeptide repeat protein n=1 Tax=Streptomyces machairae TaxID=3134109 RepID=A0ABU8UGL5_9ACTN